MRFEEFITITNGLPVIESEFLCAGEQDSVSFKVQLNRWVKTGKLMQLKRGVYLLAEPYRKRSLYEPYIAGVLKKPSYISLEKAFEYYGLIPEAVVSYTLVTTKRPGKYATPVGRFDYRHVKDALFWGYQSITVDNQTAFFALPEKALLDFFYLKERSITLAYLAEMRLQNVEVINIDVLFNYAEKFKSPGMLKAAEVVREYIKMYKKGEKTL